MSRHVKIIIMAVVVFVAIGAIALLGTMGGRHGNEPANVETAVEETKPADAPGEFVLNPMPRKHWLYCAVLVNDSRCVSLDSGSPIFMQCVFSAPGAEGEVPLPSAEGIAIDLADSGGSWVVTDWTPLGTPPETVPQGQTVTMAWQASQQLPGGDYLMAVIMPPYYSPEAGLSGTYCEPASFSVLETPPNEYRNAMFARRIKMLAGKTGEVLAELQRLSAASPDDNSLRMELVDALDSAGRSAEARKELLEAAYRMTHDESGKRTGPVPPSIAFRLEELNGKIPAGSGSGSQDE
ncbi:MAG: hypothetical protein Q7I97_08845 [Thermovirgaceae bacterium]|nr:hypothetical protein [Thermovirgaceae bacterium]